MCKRGINIGYNVDRNRVCRAIGLARLSAVGLHVVDNDRLNAGAAFCALGTSPVTRSRSTLGGVNSLPKCLGRRRCCMFCQEGDCLTEHHQGAERKPKVIA